MRGEAFGVAFDSLPTDNLYPAVTIFNDEVTCKIKLAPPPMSLGQRKQAEADEE